MLESWVIGALDADDRQAVDEHLLTCRECEAYVEQLGRSVHALPLLGPSTERPSPELRDRLMSRISASQSNAQSGIQSVPASSVATPASPNSGVAKDALRHPAWMSAGSTALAGMLVLALIVVSAWANSINNQLEDAREDIEYLQETGGTISEDSDVRLYGMQPMCTTCEGNGRVAIDLADQVGVVVAWNLNPALEHQVWCSGKGGERQQVSELRINDDGGAVGTFPLPLMTTGYSEVYLQDSNGDIMYVSNIDGPANAASSTPGATPPRP